MPVWVWKQVRRKKEDSRLSMPEAGRDGFGTVVVVVRFCEDDLVRGLLALLELGFGLLLLLLEV